MQIALPRGWTLITTRSSETALMLVNGLRTMLAVTYVPLADNVARLDTTRPTWLLELDSGCSAEHHCWAMIDVL